MSYGDSETPPTYYFSGITFNPSFYSSDYITKTTGKKYFLSYPIAQGTETISTLNASTIKSSASNDTVNLFNNITNGTINLSKFAIKQNQIRSIDNTAALNLFDDNTGIVSMCSGLQLSQNKIDCSSNSTTYRLFDTITSGAIYLGAGLLSGSCNIASTLSTGTLNLGNTTGTATNLMGDVVIGNDTNNSTSAHNGTCQINKLKVGANGTPYRYMITQTGIGAGVESVITSYAIPNAPSGMGNPIVIASINQTSTTSVYLVMIEVTGTNTFNYIKRQLFNSPLVLTNAQSESFSYVAYWL